MKMRRHSRYESGRHDIARLVIMLALSIMANGCSASRPILYPNHHYQQVGADGAESDIEECRELAESAGASATQGRTAQVGTSTVAGGAIGAAAGAVGGAVIGNPGRGAKVGAASGGTAGFLRGLFRKPRPGAAYTRVVDRCLRERRYEPMGWQ
jgi:uncharacterized protein YcfJ